MSLEKGFNTTWAPSGDLLLSHLAKIYRIHEETGDKYLNLHFNVLHGNSFIVPFLWSAQIFHSRISAVLGFTIHTWIRIRSLLGYSYGHDMIYADDLTEVSFEDAMVLRRAISKTTWIYDHEEGDLVVLDNHRIAHGRSPYFSGNRRVLVSLYH